MLLAQKRQNQVYLVLGGLTIVLLLAGFYYYRSRLKHRANLSLQVKNEEINKQNQEKEILLREIHHRVKNNLQVISSLLNMQSRTLQDTSAIDAMRESQSRVKTMALIHEKLYQYDNLSKINMKEYMIQLSDFLTNTYRSEKSIRVIVDADNINLDIDTAVPLGLIANELITNAWKYAFTDTDEGEITIRLSIIRNNYYKLEISDTGKGIEGMENSTTSGSLGLKLVRSLTRQINGSLEIIPAPGTTFMIEFTEMKVAA